MSSIKFVPVPLTERIPEKLSNIGEAIDAHSVVVNRTTREVLPTTGTTFSYAATSILEFVIADSGYADWQTTALTYRVNVLNANGNTCLENGYSCFRRCELLVNGVVVSVIDNVPQLVGQVISCTANQDYYDSILSRSGFWIDNKSLRLNNGPGVCQDIVSKAAVISAQQKQPTATGGMDIWLDLSPIVRMFSMPSFFPLRNVSNVTLRLYLAADNEALFCADGYSYAQAVTNADPTATYQLSRVKLNFDSVMLTPSFTQSYDAFIAATAGMPDGGLSILMEDYTTQRSLVGQGQESDILLSKSCKYLCSVYGSLHQTTDLSNKRRIKSERQKIANLSGVQVNIGGVYYPNTRPLTRAQVLAETDKAWNRAYDTLAGCLQNQTTAVGFNSYTGVIPFGGAIAGNFDDADAIFVDSTIDSSGAAYFPDVRYGIVNHGTFGVNTEQVIMGSGSNTLNGVSLTGGAPAIMKLYSDVPFPGDTLALSLIGTLHYKKILKIRGDNNVEVIE